MKRPLGAAGHDPAGRKPARRRHGSINLRAGVTGIVLVLLFVLAGVTPAQATTIDGFQLSENTVGPGTTLTATATFTAEQVGSTDVTINLPPGLDGVATWRSATLSTVPDSGQSQVCVVDSPPSTAACLWRPVSIGETATLTAVPYLPPTTPGGVYDLTARGSVTQTLTQRLTVVAEAWSTVSVSPSAANAGATALATGTFQARSSGDLTVGVYLEGTRGNGTLGSPVSVGGLTNCALDGAQRSYSCTWPAAIAGDTQSIVVPVLVAAGTPVGSTFVVTACSNPNQPGLSRCERTNLAIVAVPTLAYPAGTGTVGTAFGPLSPQVSGLTSPVRYAVTKSTLPAGLSLDAATGDISGTPSQVGTSLVEITATGAAGRTATAKVTIAINRRATHLDYPAGAGQVGTALSPLRPTTSGLVAPVRYALTGGSLPAGVRLEASTGVISGTPTAAGTRTATVTATGASGGTASAQVVITVVGQQATGQLSYPTGLGQVGVVLNPLTPHVAGLTGTVSYAVTAGALPAGTRLDSSTGVISGTPTSPGASTVTVTATGSGGATATASVNLTITDAPPSPHLSYPTGTGQVGIALNPLVPQVAGVPGTVSYAVTSGSLPAGVTLDSSTGVISGTPSAGGSSTGTVTASGSGGATATAQVTIAVTGGQGTAHLSYPAGVGQVGLMLDPLTPQVAGISQPLSYAVVSGELPRGTRLDPVTGSITGTPLVAGSFSVTVQVTGSDGTATADVTMRINGRMVQAPRRSARPPARLIVPGQTVVTPSLAITNAGKRVRTRVVCSRSAALAPTGDVAAACDIRRGPGTRVTVVVTSPDVRVVVVQTAPGSLAYQPYRVRAVYRGGHRT